MAEVRNEKAATTQAIFRAALADGVSATRAHTLAECLYWSQHSPHRVDGKPALYKTGPELSDKLGLSPRTINAHFKRLADEGFWDIEYRPRPHHPSPVSWLVIAERSRALLIMAQKSDGRSRPLHSIEYDRRAQSDVDECDVQTLENDTAYRETNRQYDREESSFISDNELGRNELSSKISRRIRAPSYVKASLELEKFVESILSSLAYLDLDAWDMSSRHNWEHSQEILEKMQREGLEDLPTQIEVISEVFARWSALRHCMGSRYSNHDGNRYRPTPMALNHEFGTLIRHVSEDYTCSIDAGASLKGGFTGGFE